MISLYINYPNEQFTIHGDPGCPSIRKHGKKGQRRSTVAADTLSAILKDFSEGKIKFASRPALNDLWLDISLGTPEAEQAVVEVVHAILSQRYTPFSRTEIKPPHCP